MGLMKMLFQRKEGTEEKEGGKIESTRDRLANNFRANIFLYSLM